MQFDWDPDKADSNLVKHGIDFDDAVRVFEDPRARTTDVTQPEYGEERFKTVGMVDGRIIAVIFTDRGLFDGSSRPEGVAEMSDENTVRARLLDDGTVVRVHPDGTTTPIEETRTDWARLDAMTEEEIEANALADPDSAPETEEEIAAMWGGDYLKGLRARLDMTQEEFSRQFRIPLGTLRDWEQGVSSPNATARALLRIIAREPEAVLRALAG